MTHFQKILSWIEKQFFINVYTRIDIRGNESHDCSIILITIQVSVSLSVLERTDCESVSWNSTSGTASIAVSRFTRWRICCRFDALLFRDWLISGSSTKYSLLFAEESEKLKRQEKLIQVWIEHICFFYYFEVIFTNLFEV